MTMKPEFVREIDAGRDALALIDAAITKDERAAAFLIDDWKRDPEPLIRHIAGTAALLAHRVGTTSGVNACRVIQAARDGIAAAERIAGL